MSAIINVGLGLIFFASVMVIIIPLLNNVLTPDVIEFLNDTMDNLEFFVGSANLNLFLIMITTLLFIVVLRFAFSFFNISSDK